MANTDKNILITPQIGSSTNDPSIVFSGGDSSSPGGPYNITLTVYPDENGTLSFDGSAGQLFSITNSLTGTIFSVNDISGIPSIEVDDDGTIRLAEFDGNVLIGTDTENSPPSKFQVLGDVYIDGDISYSGSVDATTLDGLDSLQFLRSDTADYLTSGILYIDQSGIGTEQYISGYTGNSLNIVGNSTYGMQLLTYFATAPIVISASAVNVTTGDLNLSNNLSLLDSKRAYFGTGDDASFYHDGANFYITNAIGDIYVQDAIYFSGDITVDSNIDGNLFKTVSSLPSDSPLPNKQTYYLDTLDGYAPIGYYIYDGNGWVCTQQEGTASLSSSSGSLSATLIAGVTYDLTLTENITTLDIQIDAYGSVIIITDNSGSPTYTISEPSTGSPIANFKRKSTGLDDISATYAEIVVSKSNFGIVYSAVELVAL